MDRRCTRTDRLISRLRKAIPDLPLSVEFRRTYASAAARNAGAWSWTVHDPANPGAVQIGSQWPVGALLAASEWDVSGPNRYGEINIDPVRSSTEGE